MSSTKLVGIIKEGWLGEEIKSYKNGILFVPAVCDKLLHKYVPESERTKIDFDFQLLIHIYLLAIGKNLMTRLVILIVLKIVLYGIYVVLVFSPQKIKKR